MAEATKVLYDVKDAIAQLNKLNKKVDQSGDKANKAFEKGGSSAKLFDKALGKIPGTAGKAATGLRSVAGALGGIGAVGAVAAAGIASVIANMVDLKDILRDTTANYLAFVKATERLRQTDEVISNFGDVAAQREIENSKRSIKLEQADKAREQNAVETARDAAQRRLDIFRDEIARRESILKTSLDREQSLRDRLADRNVQDASAGFSGPIGKKALDLGAAARQAAFEGNLDLAEELEEAAKRAGEEAGNHSLFLKDQESTRNAINSKIQSEIGKQEQVSKKAADQVQQAKKYATELESVIEKENERLKIILRQSRELSAQAKLVKDAALNQRNLEQADTGARGARTAAKNISQAFTDGGRTFFEGGKDFVSNFKQVLLGGGADQRTVDNFQASGFQALENIVKQAAEINRGGDVTIGQLGENAGGLREASSIARILEKAIQEGRVSGGAEAQAKKFVEIVNQAEKLFSETAATRRVRGDDTLVGREGTQSTSRADLDASRQALLQLPDKIGTAVANAISGQSAASSVPGGGQTTQGAPQSVGTTRQNITVNATVKGGIIDAETTKTITEIIRKEIRKGTGVAPQ